MAGKDSGIDLTCPVCYDTFTAPRFLPCHHTLCTDCISDLMERAAGLDHFLCPLCQGRVALPEDGVTAFQVNFYLAPLLAGKARVRSGQVSGEKTSESSPSSSFDLSCDAHWSGSGEMTSFCRTCFSLVCHFSCPQHQGQGHDVVDVASEAVNQRSEVRRQLLSLTTFQGALADLEDECQHRVTALEESCQQVAHKMESTLQQACAKISSRATKSMEKINGLKGRIAKVVEGERKNIQEKMKTLSALEKTASDILSTSDAEFLRRKTKVMARIQSAMSKVPPSRGSLQFSFKMSGDVQTMVSKDSSLGYTTVHFHSPVLRHRMTLESTKQQRKLRKLWPGSDGSVLVSVGNCLVTITPDFKETKRLEFPAEVVDFLPSGDSHVYVVLSFPHAVKVLNTSNDVAADFVSPLNPPTAIAFNHKQELVFASHDGKELSLTFYSTSGARLKRITIPKSDFTPVSMTVSKRGHLFLCSSAELLCLDMDFSDLASLGDIRGLEPRCVSGLSGMGSGWETCLWPTGLPATWSIVDLCDKGLNRKTELVQWERGTTDEDVDFSKGLIPRISCAVVDTSGKLWIGQEDGQVSIYDWLLRAS